MMSRTTMIFVFLATTLATFEPGETPLDSTLAVWETASIQCDAVTAESLIERYRESHSGHEIACAATLLSTVRVDQLQKEFTWKVISSVDGQTLLTGLPTDAVESLFYSAVEVSLDADGKAQAVRFRDLNGQLRPESIRPLPKARKTVTRPRPRLFIANSSEFSVESTTGIVQVAFDDTDDSEALTPAVSPLGDQPVVPGTDDNDDKHREILGILDHWTNAGRKIKVADIEFRKTEYDSAYRVEIRSVGRLHYEAEDKGLLSISPLPLAPETRSNRTSPDGVAYQMGTGTPALLYWTGKELHRLDQINKSCETFAIPSIDDSPDVRQVGSWDVVWTRLVSPRKHLPGFIELDTDTLMGRFDWTVLVDDNQRIVLIARSRLAEEKRHYSELHIVIDPKTFMTQAVKVIDSAGSRETVYMIDKLNLNEPRRLDHASWEPDLRQYQKLTSPPLAPPSVAE